MNKEITLFKNPQLGDMRVWVDNSGEVRFNLYDVCFNLGYVKLNSVGKAYLRKELIENICENLSICGVSPTDTNILIDREVNFEDTYISEPHFYDLVLESGAKHAREYRKWVTNEVLPSIRKNGAYMLPDTLAQAIANPDFAIGLLQKLKEEQDKIRELKPKADYCDKVLLPANLKTTTDIAKDLGMSAQKLNKSLHNLGIVYKKGDTWYLYSRYENLVPEYCDYHITEYGQLLKWTELGRKFIVEKLKIL